MLNVAGLVPFTTIDYPGHLSAVIFCQGCPWRCHYCHNPHLQPFKQGAVVWNDVLAFLSKRKGFLDAVVFSGGEPILQKNLVEAMRQVKAFGMKVGLHTAGIYPSLLAKVLPHIDWVGMDIKAPFDAYEKVTDVAQSGRAAKRSAELILKSGVDHQFRTTVDPKLLSKDDLLEIERELKEMGIHSHVYQKVTPSIISSDEKVARVV